MSDHDKDACAGGSDRRKHCDMVVEMSTRFDSFMERYEEDRRTAKEWRYEITESLKKIQEEISCMRPGYKIGLWVIVTVIGAAIITLVQKIASVLKVHF